MELSLVSCFKHFKLFCAFYNLKKCVPILVHGNHTCATDAVDRDQAGKMVGYSFKEKDRSTVGEREA